MWGWVGLYGRPLVGDAARALMSRHLQVTHSGRP